MPRNEDVSNLVTLRQLLKLRPYLTERWVRTLVAGRMIPHYRLGGRLLFKVAEIDEVVRAGRRLATHPTNHLPDPP